MSHDWKALGESFKKNTEIMNQIMVSAGFQFGIGLANNILIDLIETHPDVYAAKTLPPPPAPVNFALANPNKLDLVYEEWKQRLVDIVENKELFTSKFPSYPAEITEDLKYAKFFRIKIDPVGVKELK